MNPRSISEAKRTARTKGAASKAARDARDGDIDNPEKQAAADDANRASCEASVPVYQMKLRRHGVRTRRARRLDHYLFAPDRAEAGRKATDDRKAARQLRRDTERAERAEREEQARAEVTS